MFDWTAQAVQDAKSQIGEVERLTSNLESAKSTISTLESKLDELVKLKSEQDSQMLAQFAALLNEKKLKIRNQQRVLSSAKIDRKALRGLGRAGAEEEGEQSKSVTSHKRKATTAPVVSSDDDAFDTMDVDEGNEEGGLRSRDDFQADTESDRASTPEQETEDEQSEPEDPKPKQDKASSAPAKRSSQRSKQSSKKDGGPATQKDHHTRQAVKEQEKTSPSPPPRRDLPFNRRAEVKAKEPERGRREQQSDDEDEETATEDDDEL